MSLINQTQLDQLVALAASMPPGDLVEVGVYRGGSALRLAEVARAQGRRLWLFDTFTGIPCAGEFDSHHKVGDFSDCSLDEVRRLVPDAEFVVGDCRTTLRAFDRRVAFAHIDCDQYESVRSCIVELSPRMAPGGVMWFDDYHCTSGATKAVDDLLGDRIEVHACDKYFARF